MAQGNIERFVAMLKADEGLRARLEAAVREHGDDADARRAFDATVGAISAEVGLPVTYDDALAAYEEGQSGTELSDDMLEAVAGGVGFYQAVVGAALGSTLFLSAAPTAAIAEPARGGSNAAIEYVQDMAQGGGIQAADDQAIASEETAEQAFASQKDTDMAAAQGPAEQGATFSFSSLMPVNNERDLSGKLVRFNGYKWIVIADNSTCASKGTITLLAADMSFGKCKFHDTKNDYSQSAVKAYLDRIVAGTAGKGKPDFSEVASAMRDTENGKLYLLSSQEALNMPIPARDIKDSWWTRTPGTERNVSWVMGVHTGGYVDMVGNAPEFEYGVRPALQLDLDAVIFDVEWRTFTML